VENWGPMVKMADLLQIRSLYNKCVEEGSDLVTPETAPRLVADATELELGGDLQPQFVTIAIEVMAPQFQNYQPKDLTILPLQVFQALLCRDDIEIPNEDHIFKFLLGLSSELQNSAEMRQLWKCCRFYELSPKRVHDIVKVPEIPKEAVVWALARRGPAHPSQTAGVTPPWALEWDAGGSRGREITFLIQNPSGYANRRHHRSQAHQLCDRFKWRLLIFPLGTESTGTPKQVAAFVELVPEPGVDAGWSFRRVKYSITLVNWADEQKNITKEHTFDFCAAEVDNGWHRGWVTPDVMSTHGWLNDNSELCFRARCCIRNAMVTGVNSPLQ